MTKRASKLFTKREAIFGGAGLLAGLLLVGGLFLATRPHGGEPAPEPTGKKGEHVVIIVDDKAPTVAEGAVLDGPQIDALRAKNMVSIRTTVWPKFNDKNYGPLVKEAGGTPAILVLTKEGDKAYAGKLPNDEAALQALLLKCVTGLPPPLPSPQQVAVTNRGGDLQVQNGWAGAGGQWRMLSAKPSGRKLAALPRYADEHPIFPIAQWRDIDRRDIFPWDQWGLDQGQHGSCVGQSNASALAKRRYLDGMFPRLLSPTCLYAQINGNRDEGAVISDAPEALQKTGTVLFSTVGQNLIFLRQLPRGWQEEAKRFRVAEWYRVQTWEELGSALQTGRYLAVFGAMVGRNFGHFDKYGVAGHDAGPGNHALHADGMKKLPDGRIVLDVPNSWGEWGPWKGTPATGRVYLDRNHLFANGDMPDCCVFRAAADDPQEPNDPPAYKGKP